MKETIIEVLRTRMGENSDTITEETILHDLPGFDSLQFIMTISELQEVYNIEIPLDKVLTARTVSDLIQSAVKIS